MQYLCKLKCPLEEKAKTYTYVNSYPPLHAFQKCTKGKYLVTMKGKAGESLTTSKAQNKDNTLKI
jgi:hypothetical protein